MKLNGWARLAIATLLAWWAYCFIRYHDLGQSAANAEAEFWSPTLQDEGAIAFTAEQILRMHKAQHDMVLAAIVVPLSIAILILIILWIARGFSRRQKRVDS